MSIQVHVSKVILLVFLKNGNLVMSPFQLFYYILYSEEIVWTNWTYIQSFNFIFLLHSINTNVHYCVGNVGCHSKKGCVSNMLI